jgi:hypothetical protein
VHGSSPIETLDPQVLIVEGVGACAGDLAESVAPGRVPCAAGAVGAAGRVATTGRPISAGAGEPVDAGEPVGTGFVLGAAVTLGRVDPAREGSVVASGVGTWVGAEAAVAVEAWVGTGVAAAVGA